MGSHDGALFSPFVFFLFFFHKEDMSCVLILALTLYGSNTHDHGSKKLAKSVKDCLPFLLLC
ncbi:uncharacterized protein DS421_8g229360 [Arachis hypogaea]|nr:uncharacterized protein DS421_8g229360 [Arachis hypogaea]